MTVENTNPIQHFTANGETTVFAISFAVEGKDNIKVTVNGSVVSVNDYSYYALTKAVVFNAAPVEGAEVVVERVTSLDRSINYQTYDNSFRPETLNYDLDRIWRVLQEQNIVDAEVLARLKDEIEWRREHDEQVLANVNNETTLRHEVDERIREEIEQEVEARRTLDLNYDTLAQVRDLQVFGALKQYLDTVLASTSSNIFGGVTAGVVFALDKKSVQTHLEEIYQKLVYDRTEIENKAEKTYVDQKLNLKANATNVYTKGETFNKAEITSQITPKADQSYVDTALAALNNGSFKAYPTLAEANLDIANIALNTKVDVLDSTNGGSYYKATAQATSLTKSSFDPVTVSKKYADDNKAPLTNYSLKGNADSLMQFVDGNEKVFARWNLAGQLSTDIKTDGILQSITNTEGEKVLSLGNGSEVNIYGATFSARQNLDNALQILTADEKIILSVPNSGIDLEDIQHKADQVSTLKESFNVYHDANGFPDTEVFGEYSLSETRRKLAAISAGENEQLVITSIGNSWADTPLYFTQNLVTNLKNKYGNAGAGFAAVARGFADPTEATLTSSGTWTTLNAALLNDTDASGLALIKATSSTVGDYYQVELLKGTATQIYLFAEANGATVDIFQNGNVIETITLDSKVTLLPVTLDANDSTKVRFRVRVVSGIVTFYGLELKNTNKGIRFNKCAAGGSRWLRWLAGDAEVWQQQMAQLNSDLVLMLEGVNGSYAYGADSEATYTEQMINRVRAAKKTTDILLISPPDSLANRAYSLRDFQKKLRSQSIKWKVCHLNLQKSFGENIEDYADDGKRYLISNDWNHPTSIGAKVISASLQKIINL